MYKIQLTSLFFLCIIFNAYPQTGIQFYVSQSGHDNSPGTLDEPFATIQKAQSTIRALKTKGQIDQPVFVYLRGGTYYLNETLVFKPEDSGTEDHPIYYQAYKKERVTLSGGIPVDNWKWQDSLLVADIDNTSPEFSFHQLFVNGKRCQRARTPNKGYLRNAGPIVPAIKNWLKPSEKFDIGDRAMRFQKGQFTEKMDHEDVMIGLLHQWTATLHWVKNIDFDQRIVWFSNRYNWPIGYWETQQRFYVENYFEALDEPGEWFYDKNESKLYYFPFENEQINQLNALISSLPVLIKFEGDPENSQFIEYLNFKNISLKHADWKVDKTQNVYLQAVAQLENNAAIYATGLRNSSFVNCEVAHIGGHGIYLSKGSKHNLIQHCHIHDLGGGGIYVGEGGFRCGTYENKALKPSHNIIDNNYIHDATHVFHGGIGIWIGSSSHNRVTHNEIADMYYMGINVGWCWQYEESEATHNIINNNHIHHIGKGRLSDSGGIYTLGRSPGTEIKFNHIHNCYGYPYLAHMHGLYNDQASEWIVMEKNISYNISHQGYNLHWGRNLTLRNNIFIDYHHEAVRLGRGTKGGGPHAITIDNNIFYADQPQFIGFMSQHDQFTLEDNYFMNYAGEEEYLGEKLLSKPGIQLEDPLFVDPESDNFNLNSNSPAIDSGFETWDYNHAGLYGEKWWKSMPEKLKTDPYWPPAPPPKPNQLNDDFEDYLTGQYPEFPVYADVFVEGGSEIIATTEQSASGQKSLMFVDTSGINVHNPHIEYSYHYENDKISLDLDFFNHQKLPAIVEIAFFDHSEYSEDIKGPNLKIDQKSIWAYEQEVANLAPGKWHHISIRFDLSKTNKIFEIQIDRKKISGLDIDHRFKELDQVHISSVSDKPAKFYIDNLILTAE